MLFKISSHADRWYSWVYIDIGDNLRLLRWIGMDGNLHYDPQYFSYKRNVIQAIKKYNPDSVIRYYYKSLRKVK
jgi:hypothetical protein